MRRFPLRSVLIVAACTILAIIAVFGWMKAISAGNALTTAQTSLQIQVNQKEALERQVTALQRAVAGAQEREQALRQQAAEAQRAAVDARGANADPAEVQTLRQQLETARGEADAAKRAQAEAQNRAERLAEAARGRQSAAAPPPAFARAPAAPVPPAPPPGPSNITAAGVQSATAPVLPLPNLPPGAGTRDYLLAAQRALRAGDLGEAQAALERAEVRLLNRLSSTGRLPPTGRHPGVAEIERALDELGARNTQAALGTVADLLSQPAVVQ